MNAPIPVAPHRKRVSFPPVLVVRESWTAACERFADEMLEIRTTDKSTLSPGSCTVALLDLLTSHERVLGDAALGQEVDAEHLIHRLEAIYRKKARGYSNFNGRRIEALIATIRQLAA